MSENATSNRRGQWLLVGLGVLFIGPLAAAWLVYFSGGWAPGETTNHGELILPPRPLPQGALQLAGGASTGVDFPRGAWTLYYRTADGCGPACRDSLYLMRQTHTALGKEAVRIRRVLLVDGALTDPAGIQADHPELMVIGSAPPGAAALLSKFPLPGDGTEDVIYLSDPLGNLMMRYPPADDDRRMLDDLKRLLKLSRIG